MSIEALRRGNSASARATTCMRIGSIVSEPPASATRSRRSRRSASSSVMSAFCWSVMCGLCAHDCARLRAVARRVGDIRSRSTSPNCARSGNTAGGGTPASAVGAGGGAMSAATAAGGAAVDGEA